MTRDLGVDGSWAGLESPHFCCHVQMMVNFVISNQAGKSTLHMHADNPQLLESLEVL